MCTHAYAHFVIVFVAALAATAPRAWADFVIKDPPSAAAAPSSAPVAMAPIVDPGDAKPRSQPNHRISSTAQPWKMAYGFGNQVPLGFACRQIVPAAVRVSYGPGVSPNQLVNWKGGKTWNRVLSSAVAPLGFRLVMTHMAVEIRK